MSRTDETNPTPAALPCDTGAVAAWPVRLRCPRLARAYRQIPLLRPALAAVWLTAALGWLAEDSGITVPAAALPLVLPLVIVVLLSLPSEGAPEAAAERPSSPAGAAGYR